MKYKSGILLLFFIFCQVHNLAGQNNSVGVHIGVGLSGMKEPFNEVYLIQPGSAIDYGSAKFDYNLFGFRFGVNKTWDLGKGFSFRSGLEYAQKGNKNEYTTVRLGDYVDKSVSRHFNYIEIPLLLQFVFPGKIKYSIFTGTSFGFLISSMYNYRENENQMGCERKTQEFHRLNQSLVIGTGYAVPIDDKTDIQFRLYYSNELSNLVKDKYRRTDMFSSSFSATIGLQYLIEK